MDDIKVEIDTIMTFPDEPEKPVITEIKTRHKVISIVISGDASEKVIKKLAEWIRDDLTATENISQVSIAGVRPYEISIEVSSLTMPLSSARIYSSIAGRAWTGPPQP